IGKWRRSTRPWIMMARPGLRARARKGDRMKLHKPPADDSERLANILESLASVDAEDGPTDDEYRAQAEAEGIDFHAWAEEIRAKVRAHFQARREQEARERRGKLVLLKGSGTGASRPAASVAVVERGKRGKRAR